MGEVLIVNERVVYLLIFWGVGLEVENCWDGVRCSRGCSCG